MPHAVPRAEQAGKKIVVVGAGPAGLEAARVAAELSALLDGETYVRPARELGERIRRENGAEIAADALATLLP